MKYVLHPKRILCEKLDSIISSSSFFFQNMGIKVLNLESLISSVRKTSYIYFRINFSSEDEGFSSFIFKKMNLRLRNYHLSYFIGEEGNEYPSLSNLKLFGKECLICNSLNLNQIATKTLHSKIQIRKINSRVPILYFKELLSFTRNLALFSTKNEFQVCGIKNLVNNEEYLYSYLLLEKNNLVRYKKKQVILQTKKKNLDYLSQLLIGYQGICVIGLNKKIKKFWFLYTIKDRSMKFNNCSISREVKKIFFLKKIHPLNFIYLLNWNDEICDKYFLKMKCSTDWIWKEFDHGLKESDLTFITPVSLSNFYFLLRKNNSFVFDFFSFSVNLTFEQIESQLFIFSPESKALGGMRDWKPLSLCLDIDFNKLLFRINNSSFRNKELNITCGMDCSTKNRLLFNNYNFQKIQNDNLQTKKKLFYIESQITRIFNFKNYNFSLGRALSYSKF